MLPVNDIQLTATVPMEMVNAQQHLITWVDLKLHSLKAERDELQQAYEHAKKMKWKFSTLLNQFNKSVKRISYYDKIKSALVQGYYIVPNFPIQMFAIKTKKSVVVSSSYNFGNDHIQEAQELPEMIGEYKNPFPLVDRTNAIYKDGEKIQDAESFAVDWDDIEFPITMAKPVIMEATSRAMALKIFDRIGIMPATKNEDPVIIGQVITKSGYSTKIVSFMIAWHLNTNVL